MNDDRLPASVEASAFVRRAEVDGDFATILKRGDPDRGALLLIVSSRGRHVACLERTLDLQAGYQWRRAGPGESAGSAEIADFLEKRTRFDPDSWLIELDIADPERFIAETTPKG
jgi:hypothetical protein